MRISVTGAKGQLGSDLCHILNDIDLQRLDVGNCDITDEQAVLKSLTDFRPEIVIHCAAWGDVESAEKDVRRAFEVNAVGSRNVAVASSSIRARLFYISTDYVFSGKKGIPYVESDWPCPVNSYGISKLAGEYAIHAFAGNHTIIRTSGLYGKNKCLSKGSNFIDKILDKASNNRSINVVNDQRLSPTSTLDLARQLRIMIEHPVSGVIHAVNEGSVSWFEFASSAIKLAGINCDILPVSSDMYPSVVKRPADSSLECRRLKEEGIYIMKTVHDALVEYLGRKA